MSKQTKQARGLGVRILSNTALSVAAILVALLVGEVFLRLFFKDEIIITPRYHSDAEYGDFTIRRLRPNTVFWHTTVDGSWQFRTNAQGFRNDMDSPYSKPTGTIRILSLGDSHTQGSEVRQEQTFSAVAERYLRGEGYDAEVINAGVAGFSTAEALVFLENEGVKYQPDMVVLGFYANDLIDNIKAGIFAMRDGELYVNKKKHTPGVAILNRINEFTLFRWLSENSYMYSFSFNSIWIYAKRLARGKAKAELTTEYAIPVDEVDKYQMDLMAALIERMYAFCRKHNIRLVILDIPRVPTGVEIRSSVPDELYETFRSNSNLFLYSKKLLGDYRNVVELHVPHGHRHISEFTHLIYGVEIAQSALQFQGERAVQRD